MPENTNYLRVLKEKLELEKLVSEQQREIERLKDWQKSAITVLNKWQLVSDFLAKNNLVGLGDNYSEKCLTVLSEQAQRITVLREALRECLDAGYCIHSDIRVRVESLLHDK